MFFTTKIFNKETAMTNSTLEATESIPKAVKIGQNENNTND
jgi:hypothetical protein